MFDPAVYWHRRAQTLGSKAVFNVGHDDADLEKVTALQWSAVAAPIKARLTGRERLALDFGCGTGRFTHRLATMIDGQAMGSDPTGPLVREAMQSTTERVRFQHNPDGQLALPDAGVDLALVHLVLGGLRAHALDRAVAEIHRVLAPDGLLVLVENTTTKADADHWSYRAPEAYRAPVSGRRTRLRRVVQRAGGERISILLGRNGAASASALKPSVRAPPDTPCRRVIAFGDQSKKRERPVDGRWLSGGRRDRALTLPALKNPQMRSPCPVSWSATFHPDDPHVKLTLAAARITPRITPRNLPRRGPRRGRRLLLSALVRPPRLDVLPPGRLPPRPPRPAGAAAGPGRGHRAPGRVRPMRFGFDTTAIDASAEALATQARVAAMPRRSTSVAGQRSASPLPSGRCVVRDGGDEPGHRTPGRPRRPPRRCAKRCACCAPADCFTSRRPAGSTGCSVPRRPDARTLLLCPASCARCCASVGFTGK